MSFFTFIVSSYSTDTNKSNDISIQNIALEKNLQLILPATEKTSNKAILVADLNQMMKNIYPSNNQIVLINNNAQKLEIAKDLEWFESNGQTHVNINNASKERLLEFLDSSDDFDLFIFRSNVVYTTKGIPVDYFKRIYFIN